VVVIPDVMIGEAMAGTVTVIVITIGMEETTTETGIGIGIGGLMIPGTIDQTIVIETVTMTRDVPLLVIHHPETPAGLIHLVVHVPQTVVAIPSGIT
jgi:hypothetical protein